MKNETVFPEAWNGGDDPFRSDCRNGKGRPLRSILRIGVDGAAALADVGDHPVSLSIAFPRW